MSKDNRSNKEQGVFKVDPGTQEVIAVFKSIAEVGRMYNIDPSIISRAIKTQYKYKGYLYYKTNNVDYYITSDNRIFIVKE